MTRRAEAPREPGRADGGARCPEHRAPLVVSPAVGDAMQAEPLPLIGLRVVDLSRLLPGPYATLALADLGADVVKVEAPNGGDYLRWLPPLRQGQSAYFAALNTGKRSLAVDLKRPEGVAVLRRLAAKADVLVESFRPGVMARLGLGYDALAAENPSLVYCAITGYGQSGPYRDRSGHDLNYEALSGILGLSGPAGAPPTVPPVQVADLAGGALWGLSGILAALFARGRTGRGRFLDISMTDGALSTLHMALAAHLGAGAQAPSAGGELLTGGQACYGVYETSDGGFMALAAIEPKFWAAFCEAVERPDLLPRHTGNPRQVTETRALLAALFKSRPRAAWERVFERVDACCEPVLRPDEIASHPLHWARANVMADAAGMKRLRTPLLPRDAAPPEPSPALGAHTAEILRELGYDDADAEELRRVGVVAAG